MPAMPRPPTEEEKAQLKLIAENKRKEEALALEKKRLVLYQKEHERCEIVLGNMFERLLQLKPQPTPEIRLGHDSPEKDEVIQLAANLLMRNRCPVQENRLNDPHYLYALAQHLIRTMVLHYHLKHNPEFQGFLNKRDQEVIAFTHTVENLANNTTNFQDKDLLLRFAHFLKNNTALTLQDKQVQEEMNSLINEMSPELLKKLQQPSLDMVKKINDMTDDFMKKMAPQIQKDTDALTNEQTKAFKLPALKPGAPKISKDSNAQQDSLPLELSDNPYQNLIGLLSVNIPGTIPIPVYNNLGNPLILDNMHPQYAESLANVDSGSTVKKEMGGIALGPFDDAQRFYEDVLKPALEASQAHPSKLPTPFETEPTKK